MLAIVFLLILFLHSFGKIKVTETESGYVVYSSEGSENRSEQLNKDDEGRVLTDKTASKMPKKLYNIMDAGGSIDFPKTSDSPPTAPTNPSVKPKAVSFQRGQYYGVPYSSSENIARMIYDKGLMDKIDEEALKSAFIVDMLPSVVKLRERYDFSVSNAFGQAWIESNFGSSYLGVKANQLYGIKFVQSLLDSIESKASVKLNYSVIARKDDCGKKDCRFIKLGGRWSSIFVYAFLIDKRYAKRAKKYKGRPRFEAYALALSDDKGGMNYSTSKGYDKQLIKVVKQNGWQVFDSFTYEDAIAFQKKARAKSSSLIAKK